MRQRLYALLTPIKPFGLRDQERPVPLPSVFSPDGLEKVDRY